MTISLCIEDLLRRRRIAFAGIGAALLSALVLAVPADAETAGVTGAPASTPAAEVTAPVEQVGSPAPVEQEETAGATSAAGEVDVPTEPTKVVSEVEDVTSADVPVDVPSGDEPAAVDPNALVDRVVDEAREEPVPERHMGALVDEVHGGSTETIAAAAERLPDRRGELALQPRVLTPAIAAVAKEKQPSAGAQVVTETRSDRPAVFSNLQRRSGLLPNPIAIEPRSGLGEYLTDAGSLDIGKTQASAPHHWGIGLPSRTAIVETAISGPGDRGLGNPVPPDLPPPAPQSPATAGGGASGPSSVPVAALLALLALVAPATRRRLGEVAAFRPPAPFVCALERPG